MIINPLLIAPKEDIFGLKGLTQEELDSITSLYIMGDQVYKDEVYTEALILAGADSIVVDNGISKEEMLLLENLDLSGLGIENLEPLVYAANLKKLDLSDNNIKDITYIATLTKLEEIDLRNNPIEDYQVLEYMHNLKEIKK